MTNTPNNQDKKEFLKELKALLEKYDASICFTCHPSSDTYGLYDDHIIVLMGNKEVAGSDNWTLVASDIK